MKIRYIPFIAVVIASLALALGMGACGSDEPDPTATTAPTPTTAAPAPEPTATETMAEPTPEATATGMMAETTPEATATGMMAEPTPETITPAATTAAPTPAAPTATVAMPSDEAALGQYAAERAGGPGAIFVGDPMQLVGPPPHEGLMFQVPEALYTQLSTVALFGSPELGVPGHMFIYTSDYYQDLIRKANLTNPTELTSSGESIEIQHTCIDRNLPTCVLIQAYWAPNLAMRTDGQVRLSVVSFVELGLSGPETLDQVGNGTLDMVNIYTGYVAGVMPALEVQSLWGTLFDWESSYSILTSMSSDIDRMILEATGGSHVLNRNWFAGADQWFFGNRPLATLEDFQNVKIRSHGAAISDFITGMGAEPVFLDVADVYTALERGNVDASANSALLAVPDRLFEVTDYMSGPVVGFGYTNNVINKDVWEDIPEDLQQIIIEEGARAELEALRLAPFQNLIAVQANQQLGLQPVIFSEDIMNHIRTVVLPEYIFPGWLRRLGYPGKGEDAVAIANEQITPYVGLLIAEDGSIEQVPITKGPLAQ